MLRNTNNLTRVTKTAVTRAFKSVFSVDLSTLFEFF